MCTLLLGASSLALYPLVADASLFSGLYKTANAQTNSFDSVSNSQTVPVLQTENSLDPRAQKNTDITVVDGSLLATESGPLADPNSDFSGVSVSIPVSDKIQVYKVKSGDTISGIADKFNISINTIIWANNLKRGEALRIGETLTILPITGVNYTVKKGDTLSSIAKRFGGDAEEIALYNGIDNKTLHAGDVILIPDGEISTTTSTKPTTGTTKSTIGTTKTAQTTAVSFGSIVAPLKGTISQGPHDGCRCAIDIAAPTGSAVHAAFGGTVTVAKTGWDGGYGNMIVIDNNGDQGQFLYAHLSRLVVAPGDTVSEGQIIGYSGNTGRSTGPHLHFEARGIVNPLLSVAIGTKIGN